MKLIVFKSSSAEIFRSNRPVFLSGLCLPGSVLLPASFCADWGFSQAANWHGDLLCPSSAFLFFFFQLSCPNMPHRTKKQREEIWSGRTLAWLNILSPLKTEWEWDCKRDYGHGQEEVEVNEEVDKHSDRGRGSGTPSYLPLPLHFLRISGWWFINSVSFPLSPRIFRHGSH